MAGISADRRKPEPKTHCKRGHEFTEENTYLPPKRPTARECKTCIRLRREGVV